MPVISIRNYTFGKCDNPKINSQIYSEQNIECVDEITRNCQELFDISAIDCIDYCSGAKPMPDGCIKHSVENSEVQEKCNYAQFAILKEQLLESQIYS